MNTPRDRLIFSCNTGRAGSEYLSRLLGTAADAVASHEPEPTMTGDVLRGVVELHPGETLRARRRMKEPALRAALERAAGRAVVETSHMFVKTFHDVVDVAFPDADVRVVVLRRDLAATLTSFVRMGYFSDAPGPWPRWMHDAWARFAVEQPPLRRDEASQAERCLAYLVDVEVRTQRYVATHPGRCHEVTLAQLQREADVRRLFAALDLTWTPRTAAAVGQRVNDRDDRKARLDIDYDVERAREDIAGYLDRYDAQGRPRPALPHLERSASRPTTPAAERPTAPRRPAVGRHRIAHLVNPLSPPPGSDLAVAQPVTFAAMRSARDQATATGHDVDLVAVGEARDRGVVPDHVRWVADLERTGLDLGSFAVRRPLPLLADLLAGFRATPDAEVLVFTNIDIAPVPGFYDAIGRLVDDGVDAAIINRRTIDTTWTDPSDIALMASMPGRQHPGHDCFVFTRALLDRIDVGEVVVGINWVGRALLWNLAWHAERFVELTDVHLTFHLGDDRSWRDPRLGDWRDHNKREALGVLERLIGGRTGIPTDHPITPYLADVGLVSGG